jgi:hypothetical protein
LQERRARAAVVLPYQHTGKVPGPAAAAYAAGDHAAYLPPAAGGRGARQAPPVEGQAHGHGSVGGTGSGLGHILYVRDSASEGADSDEDLDQDLDV